MKATLKILLVAGAEVEVLCSGENKISVPRSNWKVCVQPILGRYDVGEGSHRRSCGRCVNDYIDFCVPMRETLLEAESTLYGWRDLHDDAFDVMVRSGLDVACACSMRSREVVGPQTKVVQNCMLSTQFGVQRDAMCVQVCSEMWDVDVGAVGEVEHGTEV